MNSGLTGGIGLETVKTGGWTIEFYNDVKNYHGIDSDLELKELEKLLEQQKRQMREKKLKRILNENGDC